MRGKKGVPLFPPAEVRIDTSSHFIGTSSTVSDPAETKEVRRRRWVAVVFFLLWAVGLLVATIVLATSDGPTTAIGACALLCGGCLILMCSVLYMPRT